MGYEQHELDQARAFDAKLARDRFKLTPFKGGRLTRQFSVTTLYQLYHYCPPRVCTAADRKKFLEDNERLFLDLNSQKTPIGLVNRHGRVEERTIYLRNGRKIVIKRAMLRPDKIGATQGDSTQSGIGRKLNGRRSKN